MPAKIQKNRFIVIIKDTYMMYVAAVPVNIKATTVAKALFDS